MRILRFEVAKQNRSVLAPGPGWEAIESFRVNTPFTFTSRMGKLTLYQLSKDAGNGSLQWKTDSPKDSTEELFFGEKVNLKEKEAE